MKYFDTLYRALVDYRKSTLDEARCKAQREAIIASNAEKDKIEITRKNCVIEEDWIEEIEKGLEFIEKAIKEERQFIRSNGEVVPIEKVKRVSRDSVEHLARHSNYFTREQEEGEDLVPDQLYTVERLSDYAVYENRFLYMLLCYLRDFIGMRYEKILAITNTYTGKMNLEKEVVESNRILKIAVNLEEEKIDDVYLREHNPMQKQLDRILTIYKAIIVFLNTPLMVEVAKAPMLKPPIQRTNVLKMNRNFRAALSLYEYVCAYDKDGYTVYTDARIISPFNGVVADEVSEMVEIASFLAYEHGMGLREFLKGRYEREEQARREEERQRIADQVTAVSRHLKASGLTAEEFILLLQRRVKDLEECETSLKDARQEVERLDAEKEKLRAELTAASTTVGDLSREIVELNEKYTQQLADMKLDYETKMKTLTEEQENLVLEMKMAHARQVKEEKERLQAETRDTLSKLRAEVASLTEWKSAADKEYAQQTASLHEGYASKFKSLTERCEEGASQVKQLTKQSKILDEQRALAEARLSALRLQIGQLSYADNFTSKEEIDELEKQYKAFQKFFQHQWSKTKKKLFMEMWHDVFDKKEKTKDVKAAPTVAQEERVEEVDGAVETASTPETPPPTQEEVVSLLEGLAPIEGESEANEGNESV